MNIYLYWLKTRIMTTKKLSSPFIILILLFAIFSCEKEFVVDNYDPSTGGIIDTTGGGGGGVIDTTGGGGGVDTTGTGGGDTTAAQCKACVYIPICDGSYYKYNDTLNGSGSVAIYNYDVVLDTTIDGKIFKKLYTDATSFAYYNCTRGETRNIVYNATSVNGTAFILKADMILLKANEPVNTTWRATVNNNGQELLYDFKIISKGSARTVNGINYPDVIKVEMVNSMDVPGQGNVVATTTYYYYAKGVGLIEGWTFNTAGVTQFHRVLVDHNIP